jgi:hypothetical protein
MEEGRELESKRAAFTRADAFLRHVVLLKVRNDGLGTTLTPLQAKELNKTQPADLLTAHAILAQLMMNAKDPEIVRLYLAIVSPEPHKQYSPLALLDEFETCTRGEMGLPPLHVITGDRGFFVNMDCNVIVPKLPVQHQGK